MTAVMDPPVTAEAIAAKLETANIPATITNFYAVANAKLLTAALKAIKPAVATKTALPVLTCCLLYATPDGRIRAVGTNLQKILNASVDPSECMGKAAVPFKPLLALLETFPPGVTVALSVTKRANSDAHTLHFSATNISGSLRCYDAEDYPNVPGVHHELPSNGPVAIPVAVVAEPQVEDAGLDDDVEGGAVAAEMTERGDTATIDASDAEEHGTEPAVNEDRATIDEYREERTMATEVVSEEKMGDRKAARDAARATKEAKLRYCLSNGKVAVFFDKALAKGVPVQLRTKHGHPEDMRDLVPLRVEDGEYVFAKGTNEVGIPVDEPVYLQYTA